MASGEPLAAGVGSTPLHIGIFAIVALAMLIVVRQAGRAHRSALDSNAVGRSFTAPRNGVALAGDFLSAASILGISGSIAVYGYDGFLYALGALVGWLAALLVAESISNVRRFTMGDVLSIRLRERPVRAAAATSIIVVALFYLLAQMSGAGGLIALLLDISSPIGQELVIAAVGALMIVYVLIGGMPGTTWMQVTTAVLMLVTTIVLATWVLGRHGFNFSEVLAMAVANNPHEAAILVPGLQYGGTQSSKLDFFSQALAFIMGTVALPHVLMHYYTVSDAREARRSVSWAIWLIGGFWLSALVVGYAASAMIDPNLIADAPGRSNSAAPLLAYRIGGEFLLGLVSAVAFATMFAVAAGLITAVSRSLAHDVYASMTNGQGPDPVKEIRVARFAAVGIGFCGIVGGIVVNGQNILLLMSLTFAVAASTNLPTILYSLFWKRFSTAGALWSIYTGLFSSVLLIVLSPVVSGGKESIVKSVDFHYFPLSNPGILSIPLSFAVGFIASLVLPDEMSRARHAEMQVRALIGSGAGVGHRDADQVPEVPIAFDSGDSDTNKELLSAVSLSTANAELLTAGQVETVTR